MRGFELGTETDRMFADAEQKRAEREVGKTEFQQVVDASGVKPMTAEELAYTGASIAPITGDIIAYKEAPEDFERAYELLKKGYKEKDLVNLGLGTAFAGLVALGLIPGIGFVSRMGKNAAKDSIKELLREGNLSEAANTMVKTSKTFQDKALVNKQSEVQLKKLAEARKEFKNLSYREKKKAIKRLNRPDNITVYHGSKGMQDKVGPLTGDAQQIKSKSDFLDDEDDYTSIVDNRPTRKKFITEKGFQPYGGEGTFRERPETKLGFPEGTNTMPFTQARGLMSSDTTGFHGEIEGVKLLSTSRDPNISMSPSFTNPDDLRNVPSDIPVLENIVSAEIPYESMKNMRPEGYTKLVKGLANDRDSQQYLLKKYFSDKTDKYGASMLPKSGHVEAELAVAFPEYFNPRPILDRDPSKQNYNRGETLIRNPKTDEYDSAAMLIEAKDIGKMTTPQKVQAAKLAYQKADTYFERMANIEDEIKVFNTLGDKRSINRAYDNVKNTLNSMAELAKFTSEYGARGSYDKFLTRIGSFGYDFDKLANTFPKNSEKRANLKLLSVLANTGMYGDAEAMNLVRKGFTPKKSVDKVLETYRKGSLPGSYQGSDDRALMRAFLETDTEVTTKKGITSKMIQDRIDTPIEVYPQKEDTIKQLKGARKKITPREAKAMLLELTSRFNRGGLVKQKGLMAR